MIIEVKRVLIWGNLRKGFGLLFDPVDNGLHVALEIIDVVMDDVKDAEPIDLIVGVNGKVAEANGLSQRVFDFLCNKKILGS